MRFAIVLFIIIVHFSSNTKGDNYFSEENEKNGFTPAVYRCMVCKALVEEFSYFIGATDDRKRLQTSDFRLDSGGNMNAKKA